MSLTRSNLLGAGVAAALLTAIALAVANFADEGENGGVGPYVITLAASIVLAAALFGWAIPRIDRPARAGVIAGALGVLSVAAFWTGLPYVLGPAAIVLGLAARERGESKGLASTAVALGALATAGAIAALIADQLA